MQTYIGDHYVYMPKNWHDAIESTSYLEKVSITKFASFIYNYAESNNLVEDNKYIHCDGKLQNILRLDTIPLSYVTETCYDICKMFARRVADGESFSLLPAILQQYCNIFYNDTLKDVKRNIGLDLVSFDEEDVSSDEENVFVDERVGDDFIDYRDDQWYSNLQRAYKEFAETGNLSMYASFFNCAFMYGKDKYGVHGLLLPGWIQVRYVIPLADYHFKAQVERTCSHQLHLSRDLCNFLGVSPLERMSKCGVAVKIYDYVKEHGLEGSTIGTIDPDGNLEKIVGTRGERLEILTARSTELEKRGRKFTPVLSSDLTYYNLQVHLDKHYLYRKYLMGLNDLYEWKGVLEDIRRKKGKDSTSYNILKRIRAWWST